MRSIYNQIEYDKSIINTHKRFMNDKFNDFLQIIEKDLWVIRSITDFGWGSVYRKINRRI